MMREGADQVEVKLVALCFGQEFGAAGQGFQIEELIFDQACTVSTSL
jgi:hypothetical protein